jgi:hypothetical protein
MQGNYNFTLSKAKGEYFMWASSDDRWAPKYISTLVGILQADSGVTSTAAPFRYIDRQGNILNTNETEVKLKDYEGSNAYIRLWKYSRFYRDDFFYGLHRRALSEVLKVPVWWGINKNVAWNNNYPVQSFFLSRGRYRRVECGPLFYKREHGDIVRHSEVKRENELLEIIAVLLRNINVAWENTSSVYLGSESHILTLYAAMLFFGRCIVDCASYIYRVVKPSVTSAIVRWYNKVSKASK